MPLCYILRIVSAVVMPGGAERKGRRFVPVAFLCAAGLDFSTPTTLREVEMVLLQ